jgi:hypothetical protein
MNWDAIGAIGESVGALGVVATLFYLALQIRLNNRALRSNKYQELISEFRRAVLENSNPEDVEILLKANAEGIESLTAVQYHRWMALVFNQIVTFENAFHADRNGVADPELWESAKTGLREQISSSTNIKQYLNATNALTRSFRAELLGIISSIEGET